MQFIGGVQNLTFNPIQQYNQMLKSDKALQVQSGTGANIAAPAAPAQQVTPFDKVLNEQTSMINQSEPMHIQGGGAIDTANFIQEAQAQQNVQATNNTGSTGNLMSDLSNSVNSGINSVNDLQNAADRAQEGFATGQDVSVHDVMIASEKATLSLQMALQLRNKILNAYSEINNIKV